MNKTEQIGVFGRMKQLHRQGPLSIGVYLTADGDESDRTELHVQSFGKSRAGHFLVRGFVKDPEIPERYKFRTVRVDRIQEANPSKDGRFFCLKRNLRAERK